MTQAEVIIATVVLLALLACAALLDRKDGSDEDSLAIFTEDMFDEGNDVEDLERHEAEEADDD